MLDLEFDHGTPLSVISPSPSQSFDSGLYWYQDDTAFNLIMDARGSIVHDLLMDNSGEEASNTGSTFFENSRVPSEGYSHFHSISNISIDSLHCAC